MLLQAHCAVCAISACFQFPVEVIIVPPEASSSWKIGHSFAEILFLIATSTTDMGTVHCGLKSETKQLSVPNSMHKLPFNITS